MESDSEDDIFDPDAPSHWPRKYPRKEGAADQKGSKLEIKMIALVFLRALQVTDHFSLGTNDDTAGKFDDLVLRIKTGDTVQEFWAQLKHFTKSVNIYKDTKKIKLGEWFESVKELSNSSFSENFKNTFFLLFTTTGVGTGNSNLKVDNEYISNFFDTGGDIFQASYQGKLMEYFKKVKGASESDKSEFIKKFVICSNQASIDRLDELIKQEYINVFNGLPPENKELFDDFLNEVENYWGSSDEKTPPLTKRWEKWGIVKSASMQRNAILHKIAFHYDALEKFAINILDSDQRVVHVQCEGIDSHLRKIKVYQALKKHRRCRVVFVNLGDTEKCLLTLKEMWMDELYDVLVADFHAETDLSWIKDILTSDESSRKIVLMSSEECKLNLTHSYHTISEEFIFDQLDEESKQVVLDKVVEFQGKNIKFGSLNAQSILVGHFLNFLLTNNEVRIGNSLPSTDSTYIPRNLSKRILLKKEVLASDCPSEIFYVCGVSEDDLLAMIADAQGKTKLDKKWYKANRDRYILIEERELHEFIRDGKVKSDGKCIHFFEILNGSVYWIHSLGDTSKLLIFIDTQSSEENNIDTLMKFDKSYFITEDDLVHSGIQRLIITGEPGIGKTYLLSHMSQYLKDLHHNYWVIFINLNEHSSQLSKINADDITINVVFEMLCFSSGANNSTFAGELLWKAINEVGNVCILCDAFDEITPLHTEKVLQILQLICGKNVHILWIATREVAVEKLESEIPLNIFTVQPFREDEEFEFFSKHWGKERANKMLDLVYRKFRFDHGIPVSSFPLHMKMILDVFDDFVKEDKFTEIAKKLNITDLYELFIDKKLNIHYGEKNEMNQAHSAINIVMKSIRNDFIRYHMICSLFVLNIVDQLEDDTLRSSLLSEMEDYKETMSTGEENRGIIDGFVNGNPRFIHRTFAEFFAALWLVKHKQTNKMFIRKTMFDPWFKVVYEVFNRLLAKGFPLHKAVLDKDIQECKVSRDCVNNKDAGGRTALHLAAQCIEKQGLKLVQSLLDSGAEIDICDALQEFTPLYYAAGAKAWAIVKLLLERGAHVNNNVATHKDVTRFLTRLTSTHKHYSIYLTSGFEMYWGIFHNKAAIFQLAVDKGDIPCARALLDHGNNINTRNSNEETPLFRAIVGGKIEMIKFLMEHGSDSSSVNRHNDSALHVAGKYRHKGVINCLLECGAETGSVNRSGGTLLHLESILMSHETVQRLLVKGMDVTKANNDGITPLHICSRKRMLPAVAELLLDHGALPSVVDKRGNTPLHIAVMNGREDIVRLLLSRDKSTVSLANGRGDTPLHIAVTDDQSTLDGIIKLLLENGACTSSKDRDGDTPLHIACLSGRVEYINLLLEHGASAVMTNNRGDTPLHCVVENGMSGMDSMFLEIEEATALAHNSNKRDMLKYVSGQISTIVSILLKHGASLIEKNAKGNTPLHDAVTYGLATTVQMLLNNGAPIDTNDNNGKTPLDIAFEKGMLEKVDILLKYMSSQNHKYINIIAPLQTSEVCATLEVDSLSHSSGWSEDLKTSSSLSSQGNSGYIEPSTSSYLPENSNHLENCTTLLSRSNFDDLEANDFRSFRNFESPENSETLENYSTPHSTDYSGNLESCTSLRSAENFGDHEVCAIFHSLENSGFLKSSTSLDSARYSPDPEVPLHLTKGSKDVEDMEQPISSYSDREDKAPLHSSGDSEDFDAGTSSDTTRKFQNREDKVPLQPVENFDDHTYKTTLPSTENNKDLNCKVRFSFNREFHMPRFHGTFAFSREFQKPGFYSNFAFSRVAFQRSFTTNKEFQ